MKNVLLTTTALVAFAGAAAAADVNLTYTGSAGAGYDFDVSNFYAAADMNIDLSLTQELNNGAVASLVLSGFAEWDDVTSVVAFEPSWVAMLETSYGSISAGDIDNANNGVFTEVAGMDVKVDSDDTTGHIWFGGGVHLVRADTTLSGFTLAASANAAGDNISANTSGSAGGMDFVLLYETNPVVASTIGMNVSGDFSGVSFAAAYADNGTNTSMGVGLGYDLTDSMSVSASYASSTVDVNGAETAVGVAYDDGSIAAYADYDINDEVLDLGASYSAEVSPGVTASVSIDVEDVLNSGTMGWAVDVAYVDGDLALYAGYDDVDGYYAGANYDLGGGASAFAYTSEFADAGPLEWAAASRVGIAMTF